MTFLGLLRGTLTAPRDTAVLLLGLGLPRRTLFEAVALLAVLGGLSAALTGGVVLPDPQGGPNISMGPIAWSVVLGAMIILSASSLQAAGRLLGGRGEFGGALLVTVWLNFMALVIEAGVVILSLVSSQLASIAFLAVLVMLLWAFINFVRIVHGFSGYGRTIATVVIASLLTFVGLSIILAIAISVGGTPNV
jgi:hypothetical protein